MSSAVPTVRTIARLNKPSCLMRLNPPIPIDLPASRSCWTPTFGRFSCGRMLQKILCALGAHRADRLHVWTGKRHGRRRSRYYCPACQREFDARSGQRGSDADNGRRSGPMRR